MLPILNLAIVVGLLLAMTMTLVGNQKSFQGSLVQTGMFPLWYGYPTILKIIYSISNLTKILPGIDSWTHKPYPCNDGSQLQLEGFIPPEIANFSLDSLEIFSIVNQRLSGTLPFLGSRSVLKTLHLSYNLFTGSLGLEYFDVIDLDLSHNMLQFFSDYGTYLSKIVRANLAFNNFTCLVPFLLLGVMFVSGMIV